MCNETGAVRRALPLILIGLFLAVSMALPCNANSITFSDLTLSPNTQIDVYSYDVGTGQWIYNSTINSSSTIYYDPLTNYNFVLKPSVQSTYLTSPTGPIDFIIDNGATVLGLLVFIVLILGFLMVIFKGLIR